jgi:hypothetical protein
MLSEPGSFRVVLTCAILALLSSPARSAASDAGVARQRMTAALLAERGNEVSYRDGTDPASGLVFLEEVEGGYQSWRPARVRVTCHGGRCTGQLVVHDEDGGPISEGGGPAGETYVALVDHATFRGRKGTYHETGWEP